MENQVTAELIKHKTRLDRYVNRDDADDKIIYLLKKLTKLPVTLDHLSDTGIGRTVNSYRKRDGEIGDIAKSLVGKWKTLLPPDSPPPSIQSETVSETSYSSESSDPQRAPYMDTHQVKQEKEDGLRIEREVKEESEDEDLVKTEKPDRGYDKYDDDDDNDDDDDDDDDDEAHADGDDDDEAHGDDGSASQSEIDDLQNIFIKKEKESDRNRHEEKLTNDKHRHSSDKHSSDKHSGDKHHSKHRSENDKHRHRHSNDKQTSDKSSNDKRSSDKQSERSDRTNDKSEKHQKTDKVSDKSFEKSSRSSEKSSRSSEKSSRSSEKSSRSSEKSSRSSEKSSRSSEKYSRSSEKSSRSSEKSSSEKSSRSSEKFTESSRSENIEETDNSVANVKVKTEPLDECSKKPSSKTEKSGSKTDTESKTGSKLQEVKEKKSQEMQKRKREDEEDVSDEPNEDPGMSFEDMLNYDQAAASSRQKKKAKIDGKLASKSDGKLTSKSDGKLASKSDSKLSSKSEAKSSKHSHDKPKDKTHHHKSSHKDKSHKDKSHRSHKDRSHKDKSKSGSAAPSGDNANNFKVPLPKTEVKLSEDDLVVSLPEISPNYRPLPHLSLDALDRKRGLKEVDEATIVSKKNMRMQMYSGRKATHLKSVPSLYDSCIQVLKDNVESLDYVGGVPYDILKPVLEICTASQLYSLEDSNPQFIGETEELWEKHCVKDFKKAKPDEFESWRELYIRCHDERERKLKNLTASITKTVTASKTDVRQAKLAYVDIAPKPPRSVLRQQMRHGTAGRSKAADPLAKLSSHGGQKVIRPPPAPGAEPLHVGLNRQKKEEKKVAPMMKKTLTFIKRMHRR